MANYLERGKFVPDFFHIFNYNWGKEHHSFNRHFVLEGFTVSGFHYSLRSSLQIPCSFANGSGQNRR